MNTFIVNFSFAVYLLSLASYGGGYVFNKKFLEWAGFVFIALAAGAQALYIGWRWVRGSYAPMSNMYESLTLMAWLVNVIYIRFLFFSKGSLNNGSSKRLFYLGLGFWVALFSLLLLGLASLNDFSIQPLVPALQSNWLLFHVTTVMAGYSAFALSFLTAGVYLACFHARPMEEKSLAFDGLIERTTVLGFLLLTVGIILGSVWANTAWGSYWSWDPKETWSLISWFFYAVALHLRKTRGWKSAKFAWLSLGGFALIAFTYFGVNYLISGLHSYA